MSTQILFVAHRVRDLHPLERSRPGDLRDHRDHRADAWALVSASCISKSILWTLGPPRRGFMGFRQNFVVYRKGIAESMDRSRSRCVKGPSCPWSNARLSLPSGQSDDLQSIDLKKYFKAAPENLLLIARHRAKIIDSYWSRISTSLCLLRHFLQQFVSRETYSPSDTFWRKHEEASDALAQFHAEMIGERQSAPDALRRLPRRLLIAFSFL